MSRLELRLRLPLEAFELDLDLATEARAFGLFGPSGSGKTTVLEVLAGWRRPPAGRLVQGGRVLFDSERGIDLATGERGVGYVPQDGLLFPHWNVLANLRAGVRRAGDGDGRARVERVLDVLELGPLADRPVAELSGGERQRTALGRALCSAPRLLLLDEPFGALDRPLRRRILPYLVRVREEFGTPLLLVSHDATEISALCDEVCLLRAGRAALQGTPADVFASAEGSRAVGPDLENVLGGEVLAVDTGTARVGLGPELSLEVPRSGLEPGQRAVIGLRSDEILIATERPRGLSARNSLPARVGELFEQDGEVLLRARLTGADEGRDPLAVQLTPGAVRELELVPGREVFLVIKTRSCRVLSALAAG